MFFQPCVIALGKLVLLTLVLVMPRATSAQSAPDSATLAARALSLSGDIGSSQATYSAFTISAELGWFGR